MDFLVHTGTTRSVPGTALVSLSFTSPAHERAFLLLQVRGNPRDTHALEEECTAVIHHSLLQSEGESWHRMDGALKELNGLFKGFMASQALEDIHALVGLLDGEGSLHVSQAGRGEAYLIRGSATSQITEIIRGKPVPMFVHISSGALESGDVVMLSTQRLLRALTGAQLRDLALRGDQLLTEVVTRLEAERELSALVTVRVTGAPARVADAEEPGDADASRESSRGSAAALRRRSRQGDMRSILSTVASAAAAVPSAVSSLLPSSRGARRRPSRGSGAASALSALLAGWMGRGREWGAGFFADLRDPQRKRRAHLLLLAGAIAAFLVLVLLVKLSTNTQRSKTRAQLTELMTTIDTELKQADNKKIAGDTDAANAILQRAEDQAKQIIGNDSGLFRSEALALLDRIRSKREEINNIIRVPTNALVNLASRKTDIAALGLIPVSDGEFVVYDRQNWYHVLLNGVEEGKPLTEGDWIIDGTPFVRTKSQAFLTTGNTLIELVSGQPTVMKTEDPAGWAPGKAIRTYLRYIYILTTDGKIYKYERLSNRYGPGVSYNVNGDLAGAIDMAIDGNVYVLKENGVIVKLFRGEVKPFTIHVPQEGFLKDVTKIYKVVDRNFYLLDPAGKRVIVATDGGANGDSAYVKQYVLEGDSLGKLTDLYVEPDEAHLYVMDEKRIYVIDLGKR